MEKKNGVKLLNVLPTSLRFIIAVLNKDIYFAGPDGLSCSKRLKTYNLSPYLDYFKLTKLSEDEPYYQFVNSSANINFAYEPASYRVYEIENTTRGS